MHINIRYVTNRSRAFLANFLSIFKILNWNNIHIVSFHALNVRSMIKSSIYMLLVFIVWIMSLDGIFDVGPTHLDALYDFCDFIGNDHFWLGFCLMSIGVVINTMFMFYMSTFVCSYIISMIYAQRMFYLYWRLDRYVKYFGRIWGGYYKDTEVSRVDVLKYFNMLAIYLLIKESYNRNGMKGELNKNYRGIELTHAIDKEARIRIREWAIIFGNSTPEIKKYFSNAYFRLASNNNCNRIFTTNGQAGADHTKANMGMELVNLEDVKSIIKNICSAKKDELDGLTDIDLTDIIVNRYIMESYREDIYANII